MVSYCFILYKDNGEITGNPLPLVEIEDRFLSEHDIRSYPIYGNYGAKVAPTQNDFGIRKLIHGKKEMTFVERYIAEQERLKPEQ